MGTVRVSVVMPVFNGVRTVVPAVESVRSQAFADWELIVVDDGSTDGSVDAARQLEAEGRIRLVHQEHEGLAAARNRGVAAARGDLIAFLDADDLWTPGYLGTMVVALDERLGATLAFAGWQYIDEAGTLLPQRVTPFDGDPVRAAAELPWRNALVPSAVVVRSSAVGAVGGFDTSFRACEDWDLWLRLRDDGELIGVPDALVLYRAHAASMSEELEMIERERLRLNEKHHGPIVGDPSAWPFERRRAVGHTLLVAGLAHLRRRQDDLGRERIRRALEVWPGLEHEPELYYELACARQPRGERGPSPALDLVESARLIEWVLPNAGAALPAPACVALGNLALLSGNRRAARSYARTALRGRSRRPAVKLLAAAALPPGMSRRLRTARAANRGRRG